MDEALLASIRVCAAERSSGLPFPPASPMDIETEESTLGFAIPAPLRAVYLSIGNGGFGPGKGGTFIGTRGGYASDFGTLAETYELYRGDAETASEAWPDGLLPFCEWGCNMFTCVACHEPGWPVYSCEDGIVRPWSGNLDDFFRAWVSGADMFP